MARPCLTDLPVEVLERVLWFLGPEEACSSVRLVSSRLQQAAYSLVRREFSAVRPLLQAQLLRARADLHAMVATMDTFQQEMILVAKFTFLQVLNSEYQILSTIFFQNDANTISTVIFKAVGSIREFYDLLDHSCLDGVNWRTNISAILDNLRTLNSAVCDEYFWNNWNISKNPFGPLFMKLICCAICSRYEITVCHESNPRFSNSKCHLNGLHEIPDLSCTMNSLPSRSRDMEHCTRMLALYICDSVRWSNMFYTLRLRWTCMDRALVLGRTSIPSWPLLPPSESYLNSKREIVSETETDLRNEVKRLCRILKKEGEIGNNDHWIGIRSEFRLWCPISDIPEEMFKPGEHSEYSRLPEGSDTSRPYHFKLMLKIRVKGRGLINMEGIEETIVWFEESSDSFMYTQSKQHIQ